MASALPDPRTASSRIDAYLITRLLKQRRQLLISRPADLVRQVRVLDVTLRRLGHTATAPTLARRGRCR